MVYGIYRPWMRRNTTIINHYSYMMNTPNSCGYGTGGCGGGISNKALAWILGITGGVALAGGILGGVFQNRQARRDEQAQQALLQQQATEQAEALKKQEAKENIKNTAQQLKQAYGDKYNVMYDDNGIFLVDKKDPSKSYYGETLEDFIKQMGKNESPTPDETENDQYITKEELNKAVTDVVTDAVTDAVAEVLKATPSKPTPTPTQNNTSLPEGWKKPELPKGYTWGKMGDTDNKYKDKTAEYIARDVLGENASDEDVTAMAEKITNMNPNAFGSDGKVTNPSRLNVPVKTTTANNTTSDKNAKIDAPVTFSIQPLKGNKNTASVTIDGKTYTATIKAIDWKGGKAINYVDDFFKAAISFDDNKITEAIKQDLIEELEKQIKADGYTNVNLYNNNPEAKVLNFGTPPKDA